LKIKFFKNENLFDIYDAVGDTEEVGIDGCLDGLDKKLISIIKKDCSKIN